MPVANSAIYFTKHAIGLGVRHLSQVRSISPSLSSALFSYCGSKQSLESPDSFVTIKKLLAQSVGSSTSISTPVSVSLSSSSLSFGLMAIGTRRDGAMLGSTEGSTLRCCSPSSVPRSPSNTKIFNDLLGCLGFLTCRGGCCRCGYLSKIFFIYLDEFHLLYYFGAQQWGQILFNHNEFN